MSKTKKYIYLKFPVGEMSEEERVQVRGMLRSFVTALYKDIISHPKTNLLFLLQKRFEDKKSIKLLMKALYQFVQNHNEISLESNKNEPRIPSDSSTFNLLKLTERVL
jgi:hypothetical protein